jgi:hypothetical protein
MARTPALASGAQPMQTADGNEIPTTRRLIRSLALPALWVVVVALMARSYFLVDPPNPALTGTAAYGTNAESNFRSFALMSFVELAVFTAILRPWSYRRSIWRAVAALTLAIIWLGPSSVITMHAGSVVALHLLWVFILNVLFSGLAVWTLVALLRHRREPPPATLNDEG